MINNSNIRNLVKLWLEHDENTIKTYGHISTWDVSEVTDMSELFSVKQINNKDEYKDEDISKFNRNISKFNQDISSWNTFNVTNMSYMFKFAVSFNQDISSWDTSNVTNISYMFFEALSFKYRKKILLCWDISEVTNISYMFHKTQCCIIC